MSRFYTNPSREDDTHALPDAEAFYLTAKEAEEYNSDHVSNADDNCDLYDGPGWYAWACFPGCLPDGEPHGPYKTEAEAIAAHREMFGDEYE